MVSDITQNQSFTRTFEVFSHFTHFKILLLKSEFNRVGGNRLAVKLKSH